MKLHTITVYIKNYFSFISDLTYDNIKIWQLINFIFRCLLTDTDDAGSTHVFCKWTSTSLKVTVWWINRQNKNRIMRFLKRFTTGFFSRHFVQTAVRRGKWEVGRSSWHVRTPAHPTGSAFFIKCRLLSIFKKEQRNKTRCITRNDQNTDTDST